METTMGKFDELKSSIEWQLREIEKGLLSMGTQTELAECITLMKKTDEDLDTLREWVTGEEKESK